MVNSSTKYRLGLDLGTNSIGWAAIQLDDGGEPCGVLDMGVRIFPDGRDAQSEQSNAVQRRVARGQRRRRDRYLMRRGGLMQTLIEYGLMPEDAGERKGLERIDPYELRARALSDEPLEPFELGRTLFHLNQRRGFKSNRKAGGDEKEDGQVRTAINELRQRIEESGARTLGEYLFRRRKKGKPVRARPETGLRSDRAMYEDEFDAIRAAQERHHPNSEQWDNLRDIILHQRRLRPVEPGWCQFEFENREQRAAKALPVFQEFRMLLEVNNLRVRVGIKPERLLNEEERKYALQRLRDGKDINLNKPTGALNKLTFNLARGARTTVKGDETTARLVSTGKKATSKRPAQPGLFGKPWLDRSPDERDAIVKFLLNTEDPEVVRLKAIGEWGLNDEQAKAVANVSLPPGYGNLSEKAIRKILPHLERELVFSDAVKEAGYQHHSDFRNAEAHDELPYYGQALPRDAVGANHRKDPGTRRRASPLRRIANPTVHIGLGQLRRVVNQLVETYGKPEEIVVELARELKMNPEQKRNLEQQQRAGGKDNDDFRKMLEESGLDVTAGALRKLRLWKEQGPIHNRVCPYSGQQLSFAMVMSPQTEVDHILPFSRTLDNSMANLVVCMADKNREKGNQTPHKAFGDQCLEYVRDFRPNKRWRFQENAMEQFGEEDRFLDRQLNETQYLSRTARTYLAYLYDEQGEHPQPVRVIPGRMTALLRRGWGLEGMLDRSAEAETPRKTRDDHRHHAVDAFVVANTTPGLLKRFADAAGSDYHNAEERLAAIVKDVRPWQDFHRSQVQPFLDKMVVSYKPDHGAPGTKGQTTGKLHEAMAYGVIKPVGDGKHKVVQRKDLSKFTAKDLDNVPDPALQDSLRRLWDEMGGKAADFAERAAKYGVLVNGHRQQVRRVRLCSEERVIQIKDASGKVFKGYKPGGNEFADVWEMPKDKRGDKSWQMVLVSTFDANQPDFNPDDLRPHPAAKRLMRIHKGDMGAVGEGVDRRIVHIRQIFQPGRLLVSDHQREADQQSFRAEPLRKAGFRKVRVDELGRVYDRGPFKP